MPAAEAAAATVGSALHAAIERLRSAGSERPRLDAELLLGHVAGLERTTIVAHPERPLDADASAQLEAVVARRERGEPVAYIRGVKEFFGLAFRVDRRALIPRPETERLVELGVAAAIARLSGAITPATGGPRRLRVADVGTGSGAIVVSVADALRRRGQLERVQLLATDRAGPALALAAENVAAHGLDGAVQLEAADLLPASTAALDVLLANLPYIPSGQIDGLPVAASFEPREALDGGPDGLAVIRRLLARLPDALRVDGVALLEIGADQAEAIVATVAGLLPGWRCRVEVDLSGLPRVAVIERGRTAAGPSPRRRGHLAAVPR